MKIRKRALIASFAAASLVASPAVAAPAQAQDWVQTSNEYAVSSTYGLLNNPITAPIGLAIIIPMMIGHYLVWCPIAQGLGSVEANDGRCVF